MEISALQYPAGWVNEVKYWLYIFHANTLKSPVGLVVYYLVSKINVGA